MGANANLLKNRGFVVTRPKKQAATFIKNIQKVGGCTFLFPLIEIIPLIDITTTGKLSHIDAYDVIIFISVNAVEHCIHLIGNKPLQNKILVTTGKKTKNELIKNDLTVDFCPEKLFNSEALLAIDEFKSVCVNKKIAIIRGSSGRDYLKNNLIKLGAEVDYIDVYERHCPQSDLSELESLWLKNKFDTVILTSASSTANFFNLAKEKDSWLNELTILLGSPRMQHEIPDGFQGKIQTAEDPSDETLLKTLLNGSF